MLNIAISVCWCVLIPSTIILAIPVIFLFLLLIFCFLDFRAALLQNFICIIRSILFDFFYNDIFHCYLLVFFYDGVLILPLNLFWNISSRGIQQRYCSYTLHHYFMDLFRFLFRVISKPNIYISWFAEHIGLYLTTILVHLSYVQ